MSEWTLLGSAHSVESGDIEVWLHGDGRIQLVQPEHEDCFTFLVPAERDKLRELLDRAAMPGQEAAPAEADCGCGFGPDRCRAYEDGDYRA